MQKADVKYKDTVFKTYFKYKNNTIKLYNSIANANYSDDTKVVYLDIENTLTTGFTNDLSFLIDNKLIVLIEHQSTNNQNMPLRMLIYLSVVLNKYLNITFPKEITALTTKAEESKEKQAESKEESKEEQEKNQRKQKVLINEIYKKKLILIPKLEFYVIYSKSDKKNNSDQQKEVVEIQKLSDAFMSTGNANIDNYNAIDLEVKVINCDNINRDKKIESDINPQKEFMDYIYFIEKTEELINYYFQSDDSIKIKNPTIKESQIIKLRKNELRTKAVGESIDYCIKNNIMKDFLEKERIFIVMLLYQELTDKDYETYIEFLEEENVKINRILEEADRKAKRDLEEADRKAKRDLEEADRKAKRDLVVNLLDVFNNEVIKTRTGATLKFIEQVRSEENIQEPN